MCYGYICTALLSWIACVHLLELSVIKYCWLASVAVDPTGNQEVVGLIPAGPGNILSWRLIMKYFLQSLSPFC